MIFSYEPNLHSNTYQRHHSTQRYNTQTSATNPFYDRYWQMGLRGDDGWDADEIKDLEDHLGLPIPDSYRAYLQICGEGGPAYLIGSDCSGNIAYKLREWAIETLNESGKPFVLPDNAIVFLMHQGYFFSYFIADGITNDPIVYYFLQGTTTEAFTQEYKRFSDWVEIEALRGR